MRLITDSPLDQIVIESELAAKLLDQTLASRPAECCGLLFGTPAGTTLALNRHQPLPNVRAAPGRFAVRSVDLANALQAAGGPPSAFYHSHCCRLALSHADQSALRRDTLPWIVGAARRHAGQWLLRVAAYVRRRDRIFLIDVRIEGA